MSGEIGKTKYQLFVKGIRGENISFVVHKVSWETRQLDVLINTHALSACAARCLAVYIHILIVILSMDSVCVVSQARLRLSGRVWLARLIVVLDGTLPGGSPYYY